MRPIGGVKFVSDGRLNKYVTIVRRTYPRIPTRLPGAITPPPYDGFKWKFGNWFPNTDLYRPDSFI
jgi:hypothetical protein